MLTFDCPRLLTAAMASISTMTIFATAGGAHSQVLTPLILHFSAHHPIGVVNPHAQRDLILIKDRTELHQGPREANLAKLRDLELSTNKGAVREEVLNSLRRDERAAELEAKAKREQIAFERQLEERQRQIIEAHRVGEADRAAIANARNARLRLPRSPFFFAPIR